MCWRSHSVRPYYIMRLTRFREATCMAEVGRSGNRCYFNPVGNNLTLSLKTNYILNYRYRNNIKFTLPNLIPSFSNLITKAVQA